MGENNDTGFNKSKLEYLGKQVIQYRGSLENIGYRNGLPHWGTYLSGCQN